MTSRRAIFVVILLLVFVSASHAAENGKGNANASPLTSYQLGGYSLGLDGNEPRISDALEPPGLVTLRQDSFQPFFGLKLSKPLPDNFWNLEHAPASSPARGPH